MKCYYGMRLRPFSIGCQPMKGRLGLEEDMAGYHSVISYDRRLSDDEVKSYELDFIKEE